MYNLLILGAGGFGRDIYFLAKEALGYNTEYSIKGFLDDNLESLNGYEGMPPIIGTISDYEPQKDDLFVCALGDVATKKRCVETVLRKGGKFTTLIHPTASIAPDSKIGEGCIIMHRATIGSDAVIGDFVLVQVSSIVAHDCRVGDFSRLDCFTVMVGGTMIREEVTVHTSAIINHQVVVGKKAQIGACSLVIRNVKEGSTVFGNPARPI